MPDEHEEEGKKKIRSNSLQSLFTNFHDIIVALCCQNAGDIIQLVDLDRKVSIQLETNGLHVVQQIINLIG